MYVQKQVVVEPSLVNLGVLPPGKPVTQKIKVEIKDSTGMTALKSAVQSGGLIRTIDVVHSSSNPLVIWVTIEVADPTPGKKEFTASLITFNDDPAATVTALVRWEILGPKPSSNVSVPTKPHTSLASEFWLVLLFVCLIIIGFAYVASTSEEEKIPASTPTPIVQSAIVNNSALMTPPPTNTEVTQVNPTSTIQLTIPPTNTPVNCRQPSIADDTGTDTHFSYYVDDDCYFMLWASEGGHANGVLYPDKFILIIKGQNRVISGLFRNGVVGVGSYEDIAFQICDGITYSTLISYGFETHLPNEWTCVGYDPSSTVGIPPVAFFPTNPSNLDCPVWDGAQSLNPNDYQYYRDIVVPEGCALYVTTDDVMIINSFRYTASRMILDAGIWSIQLYGSGSMFMDNKGQILLSACYQNTTKPLGLPQNWQCP